MDILLVFIYIYTYDYLECIKIHLNYKMQTDLPYSLIKPKMKIKIKLQ